MSTNLIDLFKSTVSETLIYQSSDLLGESVESTTTAVNSLIPSILGAIIRKGNSESGSRELISYMSANHIDETVLHNLQNVLTGGPEVEILKANGVDILRFLVGDQVSGMIDWVASNNGLRTSSASTLLKIVATLWMAALAKVVKEKNLSASGLQNLLLSQNDSVIASTPSALSDLMETPVPVQTVPTAHGSLEGAAHLEPEREGSMMSKLLPWIVLLIAALGLFYFLERGGTPPAEDLEKMKKDSIENVRKMDSIRNQMHLDSLAKLPLNDSLGNSSPDSIPEN